MTDSASENWLKSIVPFIVMCFGGFTALLFQCIRFNTMRSHPEPMRSLRTGSIVEGVEQRDIFGTQLFF